MNAVNPLPTPAAGAEPSMEEILASIRRIIADDQPLSGTPEEASDHVPLASGSAHSEPHEIAAGDEAMPLQHGVVATPQYPSPENTSGLKETRHPLAPPAEPAEEPVPAVAATFDNIYEIAAPELDTHEDSLREMHEEPDARAAMVGGGLDTIELRAHEASAHDAPAPAIAAEEPSMSARERSDETPASGLFSASTSQSLAAAFNTLAVSRLADNSEELRGLARDMLQPLLKDWLDANLPNLVESIIREEIERMARRGR